MVRNAREAEVQLSAGIALLVCGEYNLPIVEKSDPGALSVVQSQNEHSKNSWRTVAPNCAYIRRQLFGPNRGEPVSIHRDLARGTPWKS